MATPPRRRLLATPTSVPTGVPTPTPTRLPTPAPSLSPVPTTTDITTFNQLRGAISNGQSSIALSAGLVIEFGMHIEIDGGTFAISSQDAAAPAVFSGGMRTRMFALRNCEMTMTDLWIVNGTTSTAACSGVERPTCSGGAIWVYKSSLTLVRCLIKNNGAFVSISRASMRERAPFARALPLAPRPPLPPCPTVRALTRARARRRSPLLVGGWRHLPACRSERCRI